MADANEAPAEAPQAPESEATPNTNAEQPKGAPEQKAEPQQEMHGFTSEQLEEMRKFYDANGGFDKVKAKISNPEKPAETKPAEQAEEAKPAEAPKEPEYKAPEGSITAQEFLAKQYFQTLAAEEKYQTISKEISEGAVLKEMKAFGIDAINKDGSINDGKVRMYLDLKAQTVPAKQTSATPDAGAAPTVSYADVGEKITTAEQAYKVITQPGHPKTADAEAFLKEMLNKTK